MSVATATAVAEVGSKGSFGGQFVATMKKNIIQKVRAPISCLVETLLPAVFIVGLIGVWTTANTTTYPDTMYISDNATSQPVLSFSTQLLPAMLCLNATNNTVILPLRPCGLGDWNQSTFSCFNHPKNPVYGLCSPLPGFALVALFTNNEQPRSIPSFDDMVLFQWITQGALPDAFKSQYLSVFNALANGGNVHLVPNNGLSQQFSDYLNATTVTYKYVAGKRFATYADSTAYTGAVENGGTTWATIEIQEMSTSKLEVYLHLNRSGVPWTNNVRARFSQGLGSFNTRKYFASGFLTLQKVVQEFYLTQVLNQSATKLPARPVVTPMPFASYKSSSFLAAVGQLAPLVIVMAFLYSVSQLTKRIVEEKESRIREAMMIMGLGTGSFYMSWIFTYMLQNTFTALLMAILLKTTMLPLCDFGVVFFLFWFFSLSTVSLAGIMGAFFSKSRIAALMAPVIFFVISIPSFALPADTPAGAFVILSLLSPTAFGIGTKLIFQYEVTNGFQAGDIANPYDPVNMASVFTLLVFDMVIYFLLTLYFDAVMPSEWGASKHPCFCFMDPCAYFSRKQKKEDEEQGRRRATRPRDGRDQGGVYEMVAHDDAPSVRILGLRKEFELGSDKMIAVNDLTFDMYPNEITVVLGHNGAGKTTAINLMTGMLEPDGGDCIIYGNSVMDDMHSVRQDIGFCPQHNILWPQLTCREHLRFFAALKGLTGERAEAATTEMLKAVDLEEKADVFSENLSGGQKRKLSVAIAFVGGNRVIFLDEPTAGMDVAARRFTWDLLKRMSQGRTIILTTHYMDEADLLGNQIAIMAKGRLKCMGSPMFLKSRLGVGYSLTVATSNTTTRQQQEEIESMIKSRVPDADTLGHVAGEMSYRLPMSAVPQFPDVLGALETSGPAVGVQSVGISVTTLEEIFLRIGHDEESANETKSARGSPLMNGNGHHGTNGNGNGHATNGGNGAATQKRPDKESPRVHPNTSPAPAGHGTPSPFDAASEEPLWTAEETAETETDPIRQFKCLIVKRFHNSKRDRRTQCLQIVTPIVCVLLAMAMSTFKFPSSPRRLMNAELYGTPLDVTVAGKCAPSFVDEFTKAATTNNRWVVNHSTTVARAYNLSQELLWTAKSHTKERIFSYFCNETIIFPPGAPATYIFTNETFLHSAPVALATYYEAWTRQLVGNSSIEIRIANEPIELTTWEKAFTEAISILIVGIFIMIPFTFIPSTFVSYVVKERECRAKHLQSISGMNFIIYWSSNFVFDLLSFALTAFLAIIIFLIFDRKEYIGSGENAGGIIVLFLFYGAAGVAGSYIVSFAFSSHATAQNIVMLANFICGFLLVLIVFFLQNIESTKEAGKALRWVFRIVPSYCLGEGIINLATKELAAAFGAKQSSFDLEVIGYDLIYMACSFPVYFFGTLMLDHPSRNLREEQLRLAAGEQPPETIEDEDADVAVERQEIESNLEKRAGDLVVVKNLRKVYPTPNGDKVAVRNLTFGVHRGEVFGFLGTNGAGKTTSISILCGEQLPTSGRGWIGGKDVVRDAQDARKLVGYCPQFDALLELLTPEEHLYLYAGLRGLRPDVTDRVVERLLTVCDLLPHREKPAMNLSGGNKRKLSVAISLIGGPEVVFLDEPSAGMDPGARRIMWSVIQKVAKQSSVVLTTHHLEEVEVLSSRVSIMVDGAMKCIGSLQHLKSKFGSGFEMSCRVATPDQVDPVQKFITDNIPNVALLENRNLKLTFALPQECKLSTTFALLQAGKEQYGITDYAVAQTSLEQVFLRISADAHNAED